MKRVVLRREQVFQGPLCLVSAQHPLRSDGPVELARTGGRHPGVLLERRAARLLQACIQAVGGEGDIVPVSGWRSREEQQQIWDGAAAEHGLDFARQYVAPPGGSEHQTGLAIDLGLAAPHIDFLRPDFPDRGVCRAFRRCAARYGFVERYRPGKQPLTGIAPEPWHFRYVGAPHAALMEELGLCLEEYTQEIRRGPRTCTPAPGRTARISFVPCAGEETRLDLPEGCCQVSGNNVDGFVVTAWEVAP